MALRPGYSLLELVVVVAIIGVAAGVAAPSLIRTIERNETHATVRAVDPLSDVSPGVVAPLSDVSDAAPESETEPVSETEPESDSECPIRRRAPRRRGRRRRRGSRRGSF